MELTFLDVFIAVFSMLLLMLPGFILGKTKLLPEKASDVCSKIVLYVCQAALMFTCFQKYSYSPRIGVNMLITFGASVVVHGLMTLVVFLTCRTDDNAKLRVMRFASIFSNCGFMGIPFLQALFWESSALGEMLIYAAVVNAVFNMLTWTLGAFLMTGDKKQISVKKIVTNPVLISLTIGAILFFAVGVPLVDVCSEGSAFDQFITKTMSSVEMLSNMVTPLSMFVIGLKLAVVKPKTLLLERKAYAVSLNKLIIMPIIIVACLLFLPIENEVKYTVFLLLSMPCASSTVLFAVRFNEDSDFASLVVLQSTLLSILTIPLLFLGFSALLAII